MSRSFEAVVTENREMAVNHFRLTLAPDQEVTLPAPGQFYMLGITGGTDPLLKRPFSLFRLGKSGAINILYRVKGKATQMMTGLQPGTVLDMLGPLGNGFPNVEGKRPIIVAGGLGVAPLTALAESLRFDSPRIFVGARYAGDVLATDILRAIDSEISISTDDGSMGSQGLVTDAVDEYLESSGTSAQDHVIYGCGPRGMLKSLADLAGRYGIEGYVSLEEHMACGVGACLGCVTKTATGYRRVCKEGPVFRIGEVIF